MKKRDIKLSETYILKEYYIQYLKKIRGNSLTTIKHYLSALDVISSYLVKKQQIKTSLYEIVDLSDLQIVKENLCQDIIFVEKDERGHRMYTAALNNYYRFASGETFFSIQDKLLVMDIAIPKSDKRLQLVESVNRSSIIKNQVIMSSGYMCEINNEHKTFIADSTKQPYMEGHHSIPMNKQDSFNNSLDVYANIISLCPICHRLLHYGICEEKTEILKKIYYLRADRLYNSGLKISQSDFINFSLQ